MVPCALMIDGGALIHVLPSGLFAGAPLEVQWAALLPAWSALFAGLVLAPLLMAFRGRASAAADDSRLCTPPAAPAEVAPPIALAIAILLAANERWREEAGRHRAELLALRQRMQHDAESARATPRATIPGIVGESAALQETLALVARVAPSEASVLITGETGTGKELIARAVHLGSPRRSGALVSVNCPAIPRELAESELFGHERGAFTGAVAVRRGRLEMAHGGTILLDEVADLSLEVQAKLLRVLQEREAQRIGAMRPYRVDARIVAATNRDLRALVAAGAFREDLYYRLAAVEIALPPLRARAGDVAMLATAFLERAAARQGHAVRGFSVEALQALCAYDWPGNVRELEHAIERAVLLCSGDLIRLEHCPDAVRGVPVGTRLGEAIRENKRRRIIEALVQAGGNQAAAARHLGLSRSNLARMIKNLGIEAPKRR